MDEPSTSTVKRLYAVSGNRCAFPKCTVPLVDAASGKVTGRICHIKAAKPGGPRYDPIQSVEERHGFDNLIIMCPIHHDVIDSDTDAYTVDRLVRMKVDHEKTYFGGTEASDQLADQFIANISSPSFTHGSIIFTRNQMGGQVAHSITNIGPQPRQISQAAASVLVAELQKHDPETVNITSLLGDSESDNLALSLESVLQLAGWTIKDAAQAVFNKPVHGLFIETGKESPALLILLNWCNSIGLKAKGNLIRGGNVTRIIVGANF